MVKNKKIEDVKKDKEVTQAGNPRKPEGKEGEIMLERMNESHGRVTQWALEFADFKEYDNVLDIGCGGGATLHRLSLRAAEGKITGVDYSGTSVKKSREYNRADVEKGKMEVLEASVESLPFEDGTFDKIVTVESFYFWPSPAENLKEVYRVLKTQGTFLLIADIYHKEGLKEETMENIQKYDLFNPSKSEFQEMFEKAGFQKIIIHTKEQEDWICVEGRK